MRLLHYNVHMWQDSSGATNVAAVADLVRAVEPDVVSLVEVDEPWGHPTNLRRLADELGYNWAFVPAFEYGGRAGFGNALLSRTPPRAVHQWQLLPPRIYDGTEPSEPRAVALADIGIDGQTLTVGSTHLPRQDPDLRDEASRRLLTLLASLEGPWLLCGDFNQPPSAWLPDTTTVVPHPTQPTYPTKEPTEHIDYCILSGLTATAGVLPSAASDHLPLVVATDPHEHDTGPSGSRPQEPDGPTTA